LEIDSCEFIPHLQARVGHILIKYIIMEFLLKNKKIVVTGAANGNGRAISKAIAIQGGKPLNIDCDSEGLISLNNEILKDGGISSYLTTNINSTGKYLKEIENFLKLEKCIDGVVNNAGITIGDKFLDYNESDWDKTFYVNLKSVFLISKLSIPFFRDIGGSIVNISSLAAEVGFPGNVAYVASKGAIKALSKAMAVDLIGHKIRVNSVGPGYIRTNMTSKSYADKVLKKDRDNRMLIGRWGDPEDVANMVTFLLSEKSSYITGQEFYVDGGWLAKGL